MTSLPATAAKTSRLPMVLAIGFALLLVAGSAFLWWKEGAKVFLDAIVAGFGACL